MEPSLRIVFSGETLDGHDRETVKQAAAVRLGAKSELIEQIFSGRPVILKKGLDADAGQRYIELLERLGMRARIEPMPGTAESIQAFEKPAPPPPKAVEPPPSPSPTHTEKSFTKEEDESFATRTFVSGSFSDPPPPPAEETLLVTPEGEEITPPHVPRKLQRYLFPLLIAIMLVVLVWMVLQTV
ncbi:MAG: hypothetical protein FWD62_14730 [Betaproteobacteria bacterium]|nr:hypothetical protein [Betaproteobacteria bacterium]